MEPLYVTEYVFTVVATLFIPVNILFLRMLYQCRHRAPFTSSFFDLCRQLTIADIVMMLFSTIFFKLPAYGWISPTVFQGRLAVLPIAGVHYLGHAQAMGIVGIALNRFTAVFAPHRHRDFWWTASHVRLFSVLQWTLPVLTVIPLFFADFHAVKVQYTGGVLFYARNHSFHQIYFISIAVLDGLIINSFVGALYLSIFFRIRTHVHIKKPHEFALRLGTSAFLIFVCFLMLGIFSLLDALPFGSVPFMYRSMWFIVNDILCSTNAVILLALNRPIRKKFLRSLGVKMQSHQKSSLLL